MAYNLKVNIDIEARIIICYKLDVECTRDGTRWNAYVFKKSVDGVKRDALWCPTCGRFYIMNDDGLFFSDFPIKLGQETIKG